MKNKNKNLKKLGWVSKPTDIFILSGQRWINAKIFYKKIYYFMVFFVFVSVISVLVSFYIILTRPPPFLLASTPDGAVHCTFNPILISTKSKSLRSQQQYSVCVALSKLDGTYKVRYGTHNKSIVNPKPTQDSSHVK